MTLTKEAITRSVLDRLDLSKAASARAVETTFEIIKQTLEAGEDVLISGFGKFCVKNKGKRRGRNPQTGKRLMQAEMGGDLQVFDGGESKAKWWRMRFGWPWVN